MCQCYRQDSLTVVISLAVALLAHYNYYCYDDRNSYRYHSRMIGFIVEVICTVANLASIYNLSFAFVGAYSGGSRHFG